MREETMQEIVSALLAADRFTLDLETTSIKPMEAKILGVALCDGIKSWWIPFDDSQDGIAFAIWAELMKPVFEDEKKICIMHNAKYDLSCLLKALVRIKNKIADTMVLLWMQDTTRASSGRLGLKQVVEEFFGYKMTKYEETALAMPLFGKPTAEYAKDDALWTFRLYDKLMEDLKKKDQNGSLLKAFWELEMPQVPVIMEMELTGVMVDREYLKKKRIDLGQQIAAIEAEVNKLAGHPVLLTSSDQVRKLLFEDLKLPKGLKVGKSGKPSVDYETLVEHKGKHPIVDLIMDHRDQQKLVSTYILPLLEFSDKYGDWRVHVEFWQCGTDLGRWSSGGGINLQNQPRKGGIKEAFIAPPGKKLVVADYSQLELRMAAHVSGDPDLIKAYVTGADVHKQTAEACGCDRFVGKTMNFGNLYGASPNKLMNVLWLDGGRKIELDQAKEWQDKFWLKYRGLKSYHERNRRRITNGEHIFKTITGRLRNVSGVKAKGKIKPHEQERADASARFRVGTHFEVSGSSADLVAISLRNIYRYLEQKRTEDARWQEVKFLVQVHDEFVLEAPDELVAEVSALVKDKMETAVKLKVPIIADVLTGVSWASAKGK